ncbi:Histidine kinase-, DNA gyrase B-, and HSP90-like ATPase [Geodermatophilus obscurus]|uniref:histidine kinase n=1 Tax=Geodermatophilus obscurus TaxID=1861 RepID=A0A1M7ULX7_9ACTN|nr:ATP-binding protein [Geodermatophilus obscurus]SHN83906.1 Histidine kinase-, DNA gyrase B-, and HSP90-like ATPase [Geodermatophilus obscurus]
MQRLSPQGRKVIGAAGLLAGVGAGCALVWGGYEVPADLLAPTLVLEVAVGWSFVTVGLVAWTRRPDSRTGALMVVLGFAWFARFAVAVAVRPAFVIGVLLSSVYLSVLVHLLATFPGGRVQNRAERVVVTVGYLLSAPLDAVFLLLGAQRGLGEGPPPGGLVIAARSGAFTPSGVDLAVQAVVVALFLSLLAIVFTRWRTAGPAQRRSLTPGVLGGAVIVGTILVERTAILLLIPPSVGVVFAWSAQVVLVVWPVALLLGLLRSQLDRSAVGRLIVELGAGLPVPERLRSVLARTLHDPTLELAYWLPERRAFVDASGVPVAVEANGGRGLTRLERDGEPIAVLVHDPVLSAEPELVAAVAAGAGMAVQNERLHAEVRSQLREVRASRARIVEAADGARRRVERDLHDGAQQRLVTVALALRLARTQLGSASRAEIGALLDEAGAELAGALEELRELARGIYPVLLTDAGLGPALTSLAERSPVPAVVGDVPARRWPDAVERTCYFVVSEALANAAKHAGAGQVVIDVRADGGGLCVQVADDGRGGAEAAGSGLRGLADRVAALGGELSVHSPRGGGTRVIATVPCG